MIYITHLIFISPLMLHSDELESAWGKFFNSASSCLTLFEIQICFNGLHLSVSFVSCQGHVGLETIPYASDSACNVGQTPCIYNPAGGHTAIV